MEKKDLRDTVAINLRSITQSMKDGVPLHRLNRDYRDFIGESIPFRDLGYNSLDNYIRAIPDVIRVTNINGVPSAFAVANAETAHIESLVNRQKTVRRPTRKPLYKRGGRSGTTGYQGKNYNPNYKPPYYTSSSSARGAFQAKPVRTWIPPKQPISLPSKPPSKSYPPPKRDIPPRFQRLEQQQKQKQQEQYNTENISNDESKRRFSSDKNIGRIPSDENIGRRSISPPIEPIYPPSYDYVSQSFDQDYKLPLKAQSTQPRPLMPNSSKKDVVQQLSSAGTPCEYIEMYANINNLAVEYSTNLMGQKNKLHLAKLKLGQKTYKTFPEGASSEIAAKELVAKIAMEDLKENQGNNDRKVQVLGDNNLLIRVRF